MLKNILLLLLVCIISSCDASLQETAPLPIPSTSQPNIVFIIADDMGLDASPGYSVAGQKPNMPSIQNMINTGIVFTNVWSNPTCSPTRATILTGRYGFRTGVTEVGIDLPTTEVSLFKYLSEQTGDAYSNALIGKWHLSNSATHPSEMGVEYYAGFLRGAVQSYYDWDLTINGSTSISTEYATTKLTDLAIDWIAEQEKPWFLWLAYNAPHTPFHLPPSNLHSQGALPDDQASINSNPLPYYLAMLEAMDTEMGRLINSIPAEQRENTVFIFLGDNGTPRQVVQTYDRFHAKDAIYQGGINVPMVISGKNVSRIQATEDALINTTDLFATIAAIAGVEVSEINDSKSFKSLLEQANLPFRNYVFAERGEENTIRNLTHKYLLFEDGIEESYNLSADPFETNDLLKNLPLSNADQLILDELKSELKSIRN
ncbi:sulfatase-like hydrolase/transferase [Algoriphagus aquimarinus]|uniref:Arylsulfatase A n=1 Tax=Algoriphagus aquimarinus TaxID=237018 RepID=A0A1I0VZ75_9BACT|nr:sulfatase-like hydrolase/transferase [Algoriphagus aquimarinus]SFA81755.1 Arylsulfatase A [Algoriphagus aquimarinus]